MIKSFLLLLLSINIFSNNYVHTLKCGNYCHEGIVKLVVNSKIDGQYKCSGFLHNNLIFTNQHCVPSELKDIGESCTKNITFYFAHSKLGSSKITCNKLISISNANSLQSGNSLDYAVFSTNKDLSSLKQFSLANEIPSKYESIYIIKVDNQIRSIINKRKCRLSYSSLAFPFSNSKESKVLTFTGCETEHGNSGSPIVNKSEEVIGILEGKSNIKNNIFFKNKFNIKSQGIQKASNILCVNEKVIPNYCKENISSNFIIQGNHILYKSASQIVKNRKKVLYGLKFVEGVIKDIKYQNNILRPNFLNIGLIPKCIMNPSILKKTYKDIPNSKNKKYNKVIELGNISVCDINFKFSKNMIVKNVKKNNCRVMDSVILLKKQSINTYNYYYINFTKNVESSFTEGTISSCQ